MKIMNIWREFQKRYPDSFFDEDGIVDVETYKKQSKKLLFILKETNDLEGSLTEFLRNGGPGGGQKTWQPACKWIKAILDGTMEGNYASSEEREPMLHRIATMNVKKVSGGATSDYSYVEWAKGNEDLLLAQINDINPDIILLCCDEKGNNFVSTDVMGGIEWTQYKDTKLWYSDWHGKKVIWARHPLFAPVEWRVWLCDFNLV